MNSMQMLCLENVKNCIEIIFTMLKVSFKNTNTQIEICPYNILQQYVHVLASIQPPYTFLASKYIQVPLITFRI